MLPLRPIPHRSLRPWAGHRLADAPEHVGELWVAGPGSVVETPASGGSASQGPTHGTRTLDELAAAEGAALVGARAMARLGARFPLLVKVIDAAQWLSLQVHPGDELAAELHGPAALGKTEAWLVLDADPDAVLVTGPRIGLAEAALRQAISDGSVGRDHCQTRPARPGETFLLEAGTMHAIGAGVLVYEIEQPSDLTYRMSDWGRPATADRHLHVAESLRALRADAHAAPVGRGWQLDGGSLAVPELRLEFVGAERAETRHPAGASVEVVTAIRGTSIVSGDGWIEPLEPYQTLVVPAAVREYRIEATTSTLHNWK
jgi:mannose-6-phosphate isomerase